MARRNETDHVCTCENEGERLVTTNEKIEFLSKNIIELNRITKEIAEQFPEKSFSLDGTQ